MKDILAAIYQYRTERGWSEYQLAEKSDIHQSTISAWYCRKTQPTIQNLEKVCSALGITLSQLFAENDEQMICLTDEQRRLVDGWTRLNEEQKEFVLQLVEKMQ